MGNRVLLVLICALLADLAIAAEAPFTAKTLADRKRDVYLSLARADYLRSASCFQIANSELKNMGLDELATPISSASKRTKILDGKKLLNLPQFTQRGPLKESHDYVGELQAAGDSSNVWHLRVRRFKAHESVPEIETEFVFDAQASDRGPLCDLRSTKFTFRGTEPLAERTASTDCLDPFVIGFPKEPGSHPSPTRYWLKRDCAFGVHYSGEAKRVAREEMEKNHGRL